MSQPSRDLPPFSQLHPDGTLGERAPLGSVVPNNPRPCLWAPTTQGSGRNVCRPQTGVGVEEGQGQGQALPFLPLSTCLFNKKYFPFSSAQYMQRMLHCVRSQSWADESRRFEVSLLRVHALFALLGADRGSYNYRRVPKI